MNLWLDFETWSTVPIRRGTDAYMHGAKASILAYAFDDGPVMHHDFTNDAPRSFPSFPSNFWQAINTKDITLTAHNAFFDRLVLKRLLNFHTDVTRWRCTEAQARSHGLPGGLGPLGAVLGIPEDQKKEEDGKRLIRKFCGPKPIVKDAEWETFINYACQDVEAMRACAKLMPNWNYKGAELNLWHIDQIINNRGFAIDKTLAEMAVKTLAKQKEYLDEQTLEMTGGAVSAATQRDKLLLFLCEKQGCFLADLKAPTIQQALEDESLEESTKALLRIRLQAAKSSTSKFKRLLGSVGTDSRLRGTLSYAGAGRTARWAGRIFQPQNLPRPTMKNDDIQNCIELIRTGKANLTWLYNPSINEVCANVIRGLIVAEDGKWLLVADYSAIEGRGLAWSAGEHWKVKTFAEGKDIYCATYERSFSLPAGTITKKDNRRQHGKVMELSLGYGGGVGAFINMSAVYGVDLDELGRIVPPAMSDEVLQKATETWERADGEGMTYGLSRASYIACDALKIVFRQAHPATVKFWYMLEDAARSVILEPGTRKQVGAFTFDCNGKWMRIKLPSGRFLCYALPKVHSGGQISYMSWRNKKWSRTKTYGGKISENIVQAISRDLLGEAIVRLEKKGYPVVLHIHDEAIAEVPLGETWLNLPDFIATMAEVPLWARGFPINAEGFEGSRYEKH
jgi:DNA polymerase bacteriophage-type